MNIQLYLENETDTVFDFSEKETAEAVIGKVLEKEQCPFDVEINILITDNSGIQEYNRQMRQIDAPTDVLSFPNLDFETPSVFNINSGNEADYINPETGNVIFGDIIISADKVLSQVKIAVRTAISNPPAHGEKVVTTILSDKNLRAKWENELKGMRDRIQQMRSLLSEKLKAAGAGNFDFINEQNGMFSFSGLDKDQVEALRKDFGIYAVASGRICVAGINTNNIDKVVEAIAAVAKR